MRYMNADETEMLASNLHKVLNTKQDICNRLSISQKDLNSSNMK